MTKGSPSFRTESIKATVRTWKAGGAYVSVPSAWTGKEVEVRVIKEVKASKADFGEEEEADEE